ncbi:hypothetical protein CSB45_09665 [candidate division KSB3 bacterium]|uniref:Sulfotransferase domain-containing protein n=1 Tax=candidate division KSB3 bacterium TaxID=2044937 RepID=A0A2G6E4C9_9BACT|nr:MAG: hypothetical protein CSB45_09665 [candidate division KSB3 bacterium]PIE29417.1 MAG: hypothetical protein CSA57_08410 [candidate division KSB3 bacterium]
MTTIAHIINPVKVTRSSDLYIAQPITFETIRRARTYTKDIIEIQLYSAQYTEDVNVVPQYFTRTADLDRSVIDLHTFHIKRKLPLLKDILDRLYNASNAEYFIYTNTDIAILPNFYLTIISIIHQGFDAFVVNRRSISSRYKSIAEIPLMYSEIGKSHKGFDCFIFRRDAYPKYILGNVCLGTAFVGRVLLWNLVLNSKKFKEFKNLHLTFHLGNNQIWRSDRQSDYFDYNRREAYKVLTKLQKDSESIEILDRYTYLRLFDRKKIQIDYAIHNHKFLFIAGLHRSGTSILFKCLKEHPLISGFSDTGHNEDEGQFLQTLFPTAKDFGGPGKFGFQSEMHLTEMSSLLTDSNRIKLFTEWKKFWDTTRPVLLEKSPPNLLKTRFLQAIFPNVYFVVIIRHPIAVSYATQKWSKTDLKSLLRHWLWCHLIFFEDKKFLRNCLIIKYEDFCDNPALYLSHIHDMVDIQKMKSTLKIEKDTNEKYFKQWKEEIESMSTLQKILFRFQYRKFEKKINKFGYSLYDHLRK